MRVSNNLIFANLPTYSDCISVYFVESDSLSKFLGKKCFAAPKVCNSAFIALSWWILRSLKPSGTRLLFAHTKWSGRISYFVWLVILSQYDEEDFGTTESSALSAPLPLPATLPSPFRILWMGRAPVVDAPPLLAVELCSIFEDYEISRIAINSPSTPTREVQTAGDKKLSSSLSTDKKLLNIVESSYKQGINR